MQNDEDRDTIPPGSSADFPRETEATIGAGVMRALLQDMFADLLLELVVRDDARDEKILTAISEVKETVDKNTQDIEELKAKVFGNGHVPSGWGPG
jgi:hypothetical protein